MTRRVGIVGCGQMGHRRAGAILACSDVISHVYDTDRQRATAMAEKFGTRVASDISELLAGADVAIVATSNDSLTSYAEMCVERHLPVLVEKPGATSADDLEKVVALARSSGVPFQVGYSLIHYSTVRAFLDAAGGIGECRYLRACYGHGGRPGMGSEWRADPARSGGGELLDQGVHLIHLALLLLGEATGVKCILSSQAWDLEVEDTAFLLLETGRGSASLITSWAFWKNEFRIDATSTRGSVHLTGLGGSYGEGELVVHQRCPDRAGPPISRNAEIPPGSPWDNEWLEFSELVRRGGQGNGELATAVLRVVERARADARR